MILAVLLRLLFEREIRWARKMITATFAISEGYIFKGPRRNHLTDPPPLDPIKFTATQRISETK